MRKDIGSRKIILLVDDDEIHLSITELSLKDEYDVLKVKSGKEALEFLDKSQIIPHLILLDILMPEMDGWIVFDKIHDIAALKFTPIMFYTSLDEDSAKERAYEIGALDYITKPCERSVLLNKIRDTLHEADLKKRHYDNCRHIVHRAA
jgi:PleD family two-component response regulator